MKKTRLLMALLLAFIIGFSGCSSTSEKAATQINISAAASLTDALKEIQKEYAQISRDELVFNFAGSGTLRKQIEEGAPCDMFISASESDMNMLEKAGLINAESRVGLLSNTLVLIGSTEISERVKNQDNIAALLNAVAFDSIAVGTPESVPAGRYAKQSLEHIGLWEKLQSKLVLAKDVRQVLEYVETGNVDFGLVYRTDALLLNNGRLLGDMPEASYDSILYSMVLLKESAHPDAKRFYDYLKTDAAKAVFKKYGFIVY